MRGQPVAGMGGFIMDRVEGVGPPVDIDSTRGTHARTLCVHHDAVVRARMVPRDDDVDGELVLEERPHAHVEGGGPRHCG